MHAAGQVGRFAGASDALPHRCVEYCRPAASRSRPRGAGFRRVWRDKTATRVGKGLKDARFEKQAWGLLVPNAAMPLELARKGPQPGLACLGQPTR